MCIKPMTFASRQHVDRKPPTGGGGAVATDMLQWPDRHTALEDHLAQKERNRFRREQEALHKEIPGDKMLRALEHSLNALARMRHRLHAPADRTRILYMEGMLRRVKQAHEKGDSDLRDQLLHAAMNPDLAPRPNVAPPPPQLPSDVHIG